MAVYLRLIGCMLLWGGTFVAARSLMEHTGPFTAAFVRFVFATLFLGIMCYRAGELRLPRGRSEWLMAGALGATGIFLYNVLFFEGLSYVPAARGAVIIATNPVFTASLAALIFAEEFTPKKALGLMLSLAGAVVVITGGDLTTLVRGIGYGEMVMACAVFVWVAYSLLGKIATRTLSPRYAVFIASTVGMVLLAPTAALEGGLWRLHELNLMDWSILAYMGVLATGLSFAWFYEGIRELGAGRAAAFINLVPFMAALLGWLVLGERVEASTAAGGLLVVCGVWLTNLPARRHKAPRTVRAQP